MVDPLSYFSFHPVFHNWCNKGCGMYYPDRNDAYKEPLLLIGKSSPCDGAGFLSRILNVPLPYVQRHITVNIYMYVCVRIFINSPFKHTLS